MNKFSETLYPDRIDVKEYFSYLPPIKLNLKLEFDSEYDKQASKILWSNLNFFFIRFRLIYFYYIRL